MVRKQHPGDSLAAGRADVLHSSSSMVEAAFLGISVSRPYYSERRLRAYCAWANYSTKRFAFLIGDRIFRYSLAALKAVPLAVAERRAVAKGEDLCRLLMRLSGSLQVPWKILRWADVEASQQYRVLLDAIQMEHTENRNFRQAVRDQVFYNLGSQQISVLGVSRESDFKNEISNFLDRYIIEETAGLVAVSEFLGYPTEVYPGRDLEILQRLYAGEFPKISARLPSPTRRQFLQLEVD